VEDVADRQTRFFALLSLAQVSARPGSGQGDPLTALHGPEDVRGFLLERLASGRSGMRPWAALALGVLAHGRREAGQRPSTDVRAAVLELLARSGGAEERGALAIAAGLIAGPEAASALRRTLERTSDPEAIVHLAVGLGLAGRREDLDVLLELAQSARFRPAQMEAAAVGAGLLGGRQVSQELVRMLEDSTGLASQAALCRGLGFLGDRRSIPPLLALLADRRRPDLARSFAAVALGLVADKQELPWNSAISVQSNYRADVPTLVDPYGSGGVLNLF
jgi:HEAT repeat protein